MVAIRFPGIISPTSTYGREEPKSGLYVDRLGSVAPFALQIATAGRFQMTFSRLSGRAINRSTASSTERRPESTSATAAMIGTSTEKSAAF